MMLGILFSLKTMESLQSGFASNFQAIPLFSMRTESQASSQIDADAWCKRALNVEFTQLLIRIAERGGNTAVPFVDFT